MISDRASHGLARVISKRGLCSRTQAAALIRAGEVRVNGRVILDPEQRTSANAKIEIHGAGSKTETRLYLMLNKPRGLVTTTSDEQGRETVYSCLAGSGLPWLAPVGRLDKASEGLLLFSNDSVWAAAITNPGSALRKTYHVQVNCLPHQALFDALRAGVEADGEWLAAVSVCELRRGEKTAWLEIVLDEGRNRHIRRLLSACDVSVLRLVRVSIGPLQLGKLSKGQWRHLTEAEMCALSLPAGQA